MNRHVPNIDLARSESAPTPADPQSHPHSRGPRRGPVSHEWSKGPWKHKPQPIEPNNPFLALTFWALLIFCCVVAAVSIGYQLSQPL